MTIIAMGVGKRKWLLIAAAVAAVCFSVTFYTSVFEIQEARQINQSQINQSAVGEQHPPFEPFVGIRPRVPIYPMFISMALLVAAIVPVSYYLIYQRFEESLERKFKVISRIVESNSHRSPGRSFKIEDKNVILKFLNPAGRKVMEMLIEKNGSVMQSEISRMANMGKLRAHRVVTDLERKGVVERESVGKTYRIVMSKDVKKIMLE